MASINFAKEEHDEKNKIDEISFAKKENEEEKNSTAIVAKEEYVDSCKMVRGNVYKEELVKNYVKTQNLKGLFVKREPPVKEYTEEESQVIKGEYTEVEHIKHLPLKIIVTHLDQVSCSILGMMFFDLDNAQER